MKIFTTIAGAVRAWLSPEPVAIEEQGRYRALQHIDVQELIARLNLREEGRELGKVGVPRTNSNSLSGPELAAVNEVNIARKSYQEWAIRRLTSIDTQMTKCDIRHEINQALDEESVFKNRVANFLTGEDAKLKKLRQDVLDLKLELERFKEKNRIRHVPRYPTGGKKALLYVVLIVLVLIESAVNGFLFKKGLAGGLGQGIGWAMLFAALNVVICFRLASLFRFTFHINPALKIIGSLGLVLTAACSLTIGLILGHFRDALGSQADDAFQLAWTEFLRAPFEIGGIESFILLLVTAGFGLTAFLESLFIDDIYPGYGAADRRYRDKVEEYDYELGSTHETMQSIRDECTTHLDQTVASLQGAMAGLQQEIINKTAAGQQLRAALVAAQSAANAAVGEFRTQNQAARGDIDSPPYFDVYPVLLEELELPSFDTKDDEQAAKEQATLIDKLLNKAPKIRESIQRSYQERYDSLRPLFQQFNS